MSKKAPIIREETAEDRDVVRRVVAAAFGGERVPGLLDALRESVAWLGLSFVAEEKDEVVGHVGYTRAWLGHPDQAAGGAGAQPAVGAHRPPADRGRLAAGHRDAAAARGPARAAGVPRGRPRLLRAARLRGGRGAGLHRAVRPDPRPGVPGGNLPGYEQPG